MQDVMLLLDLIGSADTRFVNWFSKTLPLYNRLQDIGIYSFVFCFCLSI